MAFKFNHKTTVVFFMTVPYFIYFLTKLNECGYSLNFSTV